VDLSTGSLGLGLSAGLGLALAAKLDNKDFRVYILMGDGEINEGQVWEAAMAAVKFNACNITAVVDSNGVQLDGTVNDIMPLGDIGAKFTAFGWNVFHACGHDFISLDKAFGAAAKERNAPSVIIAETIKGKGISFMENKSEWHGKTIDDESYAAAMRELGGAL
jgi:transketolase